MNHFPFLFLREFLMSFLPSLLFARARDESYANSEMSPGVDRRGCGVLSGFSVKNWHSPEETRGGESGFRRAGNQDARKECIWQRRRHFQFVDPIEFALERNRIVIDKQALDDRGIFDQPLVPLVVRRRIV